MDQAWTACAGLRTWHDWEHTHQPFELRYHLEHGIEWCRDEERFWGFWNTIFDFIGVYRGGLIDGGRCLDVGCGPRPPFGANSTAIDPLADRYRELVPHWWEGVDAHALPAERFVTELGGNFETVLSWNCLDHTIGWKQILRNLREYGHQETVYAIATDFKPPHTGHPGFERADFFTELAKHFEVVDFRENFQERDMALVLRCVSS